MHLSGLQVNMAKPGLNTVFKAIEIRWDCITEVTYSCFDQNFDSRDYEDMAGWDRRGMKQEIGERKNEL